jgi:tetratricopeptide (TPR) repeat protein
MRALQIAIVVVLGVFVLFSCATAPEQAPEETPKETEETTEAETSEKEVSKQPSEPIPKEKQDRARRLREVVQKYEFAQYAPDEYEAAEAAYEEAEEAVGSDNKRAATRYEDASTSYEKVIEIGVGEVYADLETQVETELKKGREVKVSKAVPQLYQSAMEILQEAQKAYKAGNYEQAYERYQEGIAALRKAVGEARTKRAQALKALEETDKSMQQTEKRIKSIQEEMETFEPDETEEGAS